MNRALCNAGGFSLVELVGVIAMTSMLMMVAVSLLHGLLRWSDGATQASTHGAAVDRMERLLRPQLKMATEVTADGTLLRVVTSDATTKWNLVGAWCEMKSITPNGPRFDRFAIGDHLPWQLEVGEQFIHVRLDPAPATRTKPVRFVVARQTGDGGTE